MQPPALHNSCGVFPAFLGSVYVNITLAFTVIVILNVELICVNHNSECCYTLITHQDIPLLVVFIHPAHE